MEKLRDKVIVITGASSGIDEAAARKMISLGARVVLAARRKERLETLVRELGNNALAVATDVTSRSSVDALVTAAIGHFGHIDAFWNNAGIMPLSFFDEGRVEEWDQMIAVNIKGVLYGINAVLPHLLERKTGHILTTSSIAGIRTNPGIGVYCGTKYAVRAIMDTLRQEVAQYIKVTTIYPGATVSELSEGITSPRVKAMYLNHPTPAPQMDAEAIADAVVYAIGAPGNVNVNDLVLRPLGQVR